MLVTESGIVMLANELHPEKALAPMVATESGMMVFANEVHPEKAPSPMLVTVSGRSNLVMAVHSAKALLPIVTTEKGKKKLRTLSLSTFQSFNQLASMTVIQPGMENVPLSSMFG